MYKTHDTHVPSSFHQCTYTCMWIYVNTCVHAIHIDIIHTGDELGTRGHTACIGGTHSISPLHIYPPSLSFSACVRMTPVKLKSPSDVYKWKEWHYLPPCLLSPAWHSSDELRTRKMKGLWRTFHPYLFSPLPHRCSCETDIPNTIHFQPDTWSKKPYFTTLFGERASHSPYKRQTQNQAKQTGKHARHLPQPSFSLLPTPNLSHPHSKYQRGRGY